MPGHGRLPGREGLGDMSLENRLHQLLLIAFAVVAGVQLLAWARTSRPVPVRFDARGRALLSGALAPGGRAAYRVRVHPGQTLRAQLEAADAYIAVHLAAKGFWKDRPLARLGPEASLARIDPPRGCLCIVTIQAGEGAGGFRLALTLQ